MSRRRKERIFSIAIKPAAADAARYILISAEIAQQNETDGEIDVPVAELEVGARLEQQKTQIRMLGEICCGREPCRACSDDNDVELRRR